LVGVRRGQTFPLNPLSGVLGFVGSRDHLVPQSGLRALVAEHIEHDRLEQTPIPFHVVAVDVITGEELLLASGPTLEAVLASAAIPAVLPPVAWENRELIDGGVANFTPISHGVQLGAREVYVLPTGHACALERSPRGALGMALHALSLLMHSRLIADVELHRDQAKLVVMPAPCPLAIQPIDFAHADELIECDRRARVSRCRRRDAPAAPHAHAPPRRCDGKKRLLDDANLTWQTSGDSWIGERPATT
jgi:NTE family protein